MAASPQSPNDPAGSGSFLGELVEASELGDGGINFAIRAAAAVLEAAGPDAEPITLGLVADNRTGEPAAVIVLVPVSYMAQVAAQVISEAAGTADDRTPGYL